MSHPRDFDEANSDKSNQGKHRNVSNRIFNITPSSLTKYDWSIHKIFNVVIFINIFLIVSSSNPFLFFWKLNLFSHRPFFITSFSFTIRLILRSGTCSPSSDRIPSSKHFLMHNRAREKKKPKMMRNHKLFSRQTPCTQFFIPSTFPCNCIAHADYTFSTRKKLNIPVINVRVSLGILYTRIMRLVTKCHVECCSRYQNVGSPRTRILLTAERYTLYICALSFPRYTQSTYIGSQGAHVRNGKTSAKT